MTAQAAVTKRPWTSGEVLRLERYWLNGLSSMEVAELLGRSRDSVNGQLKSLRRRKGLRWFNRRRAAWLEVMSGPGTDSQLAERMGVLQRSVSKIRQYLRKAGLDVRKADKPKPTRDSGGRFCSSNTGAT